MTDVTRIMAVAFTLALVTLSGCGKDTVAERRQLIERLDELPADSPKRAELQRRIDTLSEEIKTENARRLEADRERVNQEILKKRRGAK